MDFAVYLDFSDFIIRLHQIYIYSRTPAFGGISLALRGRGAFGAPVRAPAALIWTTAASGGGERKRKKKTIWGATGAPVGASA